jgi:hypothetical protein
MRITEVSALLRADEVTVLVSPIAEAPATAENEKPRLMLLEDTGDDRAFEACRAIRRGRGVAREMPVVLVTSDERRARASEGTFTDILAEPYSPNYVRTRVRAWMMPAACRWVRPSQPNDEQRRLTARALGLWNTPPEERFDRITRIASALFNVPIALIALMERDREWFKSCWGLELREVFRDDSFCGHAIFERKPLVVPNALMDGRFADNPYVTGYPGVRFYAGQPLILANGCCVGTLCIIDTIPRQFEAADVSLLNDIAQVVGRWILQSPGVAPSNRKAPELTRRDTLDIRLAWPESRAG